MKPITTAQDSQRTCIKYSTVKNTVQRTKLEAWRSFFEDTVHTVDVVIGEAEEQRERNDTYSSTTLKNVSTVL